MDKQQRQPGDLADWKGLEQLSNEALYWMHSVLWHGPPDGSKVTMDDTREIRSALQRETERRGWPEGWWEDPSKVLGMPSGDRQASTGRLMNATGQLSGGCQGVAKPDV